MAPRTTTLQAASNFKILVELSANIGDLLSNLVAQDHLELKEILHHRSNDRCGICHTFGIVKVTSDRTSRVRALYYFRKHTLSANCNLPRNIFEPSTSIHKLCFTMLGPSNFYTRGLA